MVRTRLLKCVKCKKIGLGPDCDKCGEKMVNVAPMKFSPEDPQGSRRRQRVDAGSEEWVSSLPTPRRRDEDE